VPEVRVDPLTGLRAIVAGDRARRPGGELSAPPAAPLDPETDPFAEGHEDRTPPEVYAVRPNSGGPNTPGWTVRVVPNLIRR
jgi:UDPglucose--hexose-1-phosphate uridylyltransferase